MGIFDKFKKTTIESRRYEEKLYEVALEEVEAGERKKGLYSKALAKADGDTEKADGIYLKLRVQSIMDDIESEQIDRRENEKILQVIDALDNKNKEDLLSLDSAKMRVRGTSFDVRIRDGKYTIWNQNQRAIEFRTLDLRKLHSWLDKNLN